MRLLGRSGPATEVDSDSVQRNTSDGGGENVDDFGVVVRDATQEAEDGNEDTDCGGFKRAFGLVHIARQDSL